MFYNLDMDAFERLALLSTQTEIEPAEETNSLGYSPRTKNRSDPGICTYAATLPNGQTISLLKMLMSSSCERNCNYCPFRAGRDFNRVTLKPVEFAKLFINLHRAGIVQGLFLSSGVINSGVQTQDRLLETAEILRYRAGFRGYLHIKLMPGAEWSQVEKSMRLADRVSINLEAPNTFRLEKLAPRKRFMEELLQPLRWVKEIRNNQPPYKGWNGHWPSSTTQFVMGAAGESDLELLHTTEGLYHELGLRRVYYSAFRPYPDTPLENQEPGSPTREQRLYQASFLLRDYGFTLEELPFGETQNLPLEIDPKLAWARAHLSENPIEINHADRQELLRIPGIGFKGASAILEARRVQMLHDLSSLFKLGIQTKRAAPFILLDGKRPIYQLDFW